MNTLTLSGATQTFPVGAVIPEPLRRRPTVLAPSLVAPFVATVVSAMVVTSRVTNMPSLRLIVSTQDGKTLSAVQGDSFDTVPASVRIETVPLSTEKGTTLFVYTAYRP